MVWCCLGKLPVHRLTLDMIFLKTKEFPADKITGMVSIDEAAIEGLRASTKEKAKTLIDFLENNQRKLKSVGTYLAEKCSSSSNPVDYLLTLFVFNNILPAIKNFSYDRGDMLKLIRKVGNKNEAKGSSLQALLNKNLAENYLSFENRLVEVLTVLLNQKNRYNQLVFPHVMETVAIYGNNIPQYESALTMRSSKQRVIVKILESESLLPDLAQMGNITMQKRIVEGLSGITANNDRKLSIDVKDGLISFLYKILVRCQTQVSAGTDLANNNSLEDLENSTRGILVNILLNDFQFYDYESGLALVLRRFNDEDWRLDKLQKMFFAEILTKIKNNPYFSTIEGAIVDLLLSLLMGEDERRSRTPTHADLKKSLVIADFQTSLSTTPVFSLRPSGVDSVINYLKMIMESTKVNMSSFFSVERIVVSLVRKITLNRERTEAQTALVLNTLDIILDKLIESSPQMVFYFIESYLREYLLRVDELSGAGSFFHELNERFGKTLLKYSSYSGDLSINEPLGNLLIKMASKRKAVDLWVSGCKLLAIVLNLKKQQNGGMDYLRLEPSLILRLLIFIKKNLQCTLADHSSKVIKDQGALYLCALSFQSLISIIIRGCIGDCGLLIAFFRESKRDIVDQNKSSKFYQLLLIYWVYSLYLLAKRWEIHQVFSLLSGFTDQLAKPEIKDILRLLEKPSLDTHKLTAITNLIDKNKAVLSSDVAYTKVDGVLREFFSNLTLQRNEDFAQSFHTLLENQQKEKEMVGFIKSLIQNEEAIDDMDIDVQEVQVQLAGPSVSQLFGEVQSKSDLMKNESLEATLHLIRQNVNSVNSRKRTKLSSCSSCYTKVYSLLIRVFRLSTQFSISKRNSESAWFF